MAPAVTSASAAALTVSDAMRRGVLMVVSCKIWSTRFFNSRRRRNGAAGMNEMRDCVIATASSAST
jgi:steroid 5-alpha reductase family enzyme